MLAAGAAGAITMTATVDKTNLSLDDELTLTVEIRGASGNLLTPQLPSLPAFNVYSREVSSMNINGQSFTTFRYVMLPRFPAQATIGEIRFTYNGQVYKTQPIQVNIYRRMPAGANAGGAVQTSSTSLPENNFDSSVSSARKTARGGSYTQPSLPPALTAVNAQAERSAGKSFFMTAAVSNQKPYVNQPVELLVRFYYAQAFVDQAPYIPPTVTNIFMESLGSQTEGTQILRGRMYRYVEQRYALSGVSAGKAVIGPAMVKYRPGSNSVFSAFDRLFGGAAVEPEQVVQTDPITLDVQAVPQAGKPAGFYGAVGSGYTMTGEADRTKVEAGEAVNLTITVRGPGNLKPTGDLKIAAIPGFKVYDVAASSTVLPSAQGVQSVKTFKTVLVPAATGIYTIEPIPWSYFDPRRKQYITLTTKPISVEVTPSTKKDASVNFSGGTSASSGFKRLGKDIRYLKTAAYAGPVSWLTRAGRAKTLTWLFALLPFACLLGVWLGRSSLRAKRPLLAARARLKKALTEEQVADAAAAFLLERFRLNTGSLQLRDILEALQTRGVTPTALKEFAALWQRLDAARFAPQQLGAADARALAAQALALLKRLDGEGRL